MLASRSGSLTIRQWQVSTSMSVCTPPMASMLARCSLIGCVRSRSVSIQVRRASWGSTTQPVPGSQRQPAPRATPRSVAPTSRPHSPAQWVSQTGGDRSDVAHSVSSADRPPGPRQSRRRGRLGPRFGVGV